LYAYRLIIADNPILQFYAVYVGLAYTSNSLLCKSLEVAYKHNTLRRSSRRHIPTNWTECYNSQKAHKEAFSTHIFTPATRRWI